MTIIRIDFYDKETEIIADGKMMDIPEALVFAAVKDVNENEFSLAAAENYQISYINSRFFDVSDNMKAYAIQQYPDLKNKFNNYDYFFIGRQGLGPEYD